MPNGKLTWVRFLGVKDTFADLPRNAQIGDSYGVLLIMRRSLRWMVRPSNFTIRAELTMRRSLPALTGSLNSSTRAAAIKRLSSTTLVAKSE